MNLHHLSGPPTPELARALATFEEQFTYPLGPDRWFRISHGDDYPRFFRAIGEAACFVAERDGRVVGFHWTKVEDSIGEVYVVGIDPDAQGGGLGTALTARGLRHLHERGLEVVDLYVEGDNAAALTVYRNLGFADHARDTLYVRPADAPDPHTHTHP